MFYVNSRAIDIRWVNIEQLNSMMELNPLQFSNIDRAGILFYLKSIE